MNVVEDIDDEFDFKLNCLLLVIFIEWECNKGSEELFGFSGVLFVVVFLCSIEVI